jgi:rhodanese-related sulfurtransferase
MDVTAKELLDRIDAGEPPPILDVRSGVEFKAGHVPGAVHIPFWTLAARLSDVPAQSDEPLVVYCGHGPRAAMAAAVLRLAGFRHVALLTGHWSGWTRAGLPQAFDPGTGQPSSNREP